ncbi:hypothetical protein [Fodinicola feengrottensis]|uniref:Uncharacterized protein n=1 Tax=Fodinicola feengrottensis TaxID=435914 RepID=A0ABP4RXK8_9ACTN|nr:hypothetical protein [Fodinicola feengrottensis]
MTTVSNALAAEQRVAWELHVELATRVVVVSLPAGEGLLTEALSSVEVMATRCREILGRHRPDPDPGSLNFQIEAIADQILLGVVDPLVSRWKMRLSTWIESRPAGVSMTARERGWPDATTFRADLAEVSVRLRPLVDRLAELANAASLLFPESSEG